MTSQHVLMTRFSSIPIPNLDLEPGIDEFLQRNFWRRSDRKKNLQRCSVQCTCSSWIFWVHRIYMYSLHRFCVRRQSDWSNLVRVVSGKEKLSLVSHSFLLSAYWTFCTSFCSMGLDLVGCPGLGSETHYVLRTGVNSKLVGCNMPLATVSYGAWYILPSMFLLRWKKRLSQ
jgi:hypothetical protein